MITFSLRKRKQNYEQSNDIILGGVLVAVEDLNIIMAGK